MKMKKKKSKLIWVIIVLIIVFAMMVYFYLNPLNTTQASNQTTSTTTIKTTTVGTQTIIKTVTGSGEVSSKTTEKLELNTYRYFSEICVEENESVKEGEPILKYTNGKYLYAPYDLVVVSYSVPEEGYICTSSHYIQVQNLTNLTLTLNVDETNINQMKVGQDVKIVVNANEDVTYTGIITKVNEIGSYASNGSNFKVVVDFENDGNVKIGMSASCTITVEEAKDVVAVPIEAVQTKNDTKYVVVENAEGTTKEVTIETGLSNDAYVEVTSGLEGGETIQMIEATSSSSSNNRSQKSNGNFSESRNFGGMMQGGSMPAGGQMMGAPGQ